jgi:nucleoside-diphosphate-sugar epimerase
MTIKQTIKEKCLIIGCGDIGQRLARQIAPLGYQVTGLRRSAVADLTYLRYHCGDVNNPADLQALLEENFSVIVISITPDEYTDAGYQRAYVTSCKNLLHTLDQQQRTPRLILFVSSTAVYAQNDGSWVDETSPCEPTSFSGRHLLEAEDLLRNSDHPYCIVRFSGIYGPGRNRLIEQVNQKRASASTAFTNRIHVEDCAGFIAHLIEQGKYQPLEPVYVATDSRPTPMIDIVSWIAKQSSVEDFLSPAVTNARGNKRLSNRLMLATGYQLRYESFEKGYQEMLDIYLNQ